MGLAEKRRVFDENFNRRESCVLKFEGIDGYDVYNCSVPFFMSGKMFMYGRVEKPSEWARSRTVLFQSRGNDVWARAESGMVYQTEDPNVAAIRGKLVLGGVFVFYNKGRGSGVKNFFYRGTDLEDMYFFTVGPDNMKDIRLVEMADGRVGVFSRPRFGTAAKNGNFSEIGFTVISCLDELCPEVIEGARVIPGIFSEGEWGGPNQAYLLESGMIGIIGHKSYKQQAADGNKEVYISVSMVFDPVKHRIVEDKIIATKNCFPSVRAKVPHITDCTFPSGIVMRGDGYADLYSGLCDTSEGRCVIEYPFKEFGGIIEQKIRKEGEEESHA